MSDYKKTSRRRDIDRRRDRKEKLSQVDIQDTCEIDEHHEEMDLSYKEQQDHMKDQIAWLISTYTNSFFEKCANGDYKDFTRVPIPPFIGKTSLEAGIWICMAQRPLNLSHIVMANHIQRTLNGY